MNWNPLTWFRRVVREGDRQAFAAGMAVAREEYKAVLMEDAIAAKRRELEATLQAIEEAGQHDTSDPAIAAVVESFKRGVVEQATTIHRLMAQPQLDDHERQEALSAPFESAGNNGPGSLAQLPPPTPKALANGTASDKPASSDPAPSEAPHRPPGKRPRGRPRKAPRPEETGGSQEKP